jgi:AcrR family transcriptional regulator
MPHVPFELGTDDRRTQIADAVLHILAAHGAHAVTYRAIDRELGMRPGSARCEFRKRSKLLLAAAERLLALDTADVEVSSTEVGPTGLVDRWLTPDRRERSLARVELLLIAARDPAFKFMREARAAFVAHVEWTWDPAYRHDRRAKATAAVALIDGLILHGLVMGPEGRAEADEALQWLQRASRKPPRAGE